MTKTAINDAIPHFRMAIKSDVPTILGFIRELAEYEKLSHEVVATKEILAKN